ncbi:unnamed protein product, partial [marine sediment metagenome]
AEIEFYRYTIGEELKNIPPQDFGYGLCRHILLKDLKPIENFIKLYKEKKKIV